MTVNSFQLPPHPMRDTVSLLKTWTRPEMSVQWLVDDAHRRGWTVSGIPAAGGRMTVDAGWPGPDNDIVVVVGGRRSVTGFFAQFRPDVDHVTVEILAAVGQRLWGQRPQTEALKLTWSLPDGTCQVNAEGGMVTASWVMGNDDKPPRGGAAFDMMVGAAGMDEQWPDAVRAAQAILPPGQANGLLLELTALFVQTIANESGVSPSEVPAHEVLGSLDRLSAGIGEPPDASASHGT